MFNYLLLKPAGLKTLGMAYGRVPIPVNPQVTDVAVTVVASGRWKNEEEYEVGGGQGSSRY
jgi:hypothetical protein